MVTNTHATPVRGFTLLVAVLLAAMALSIGVTLAHVSAKQLALSTAAQDSTIAFYAASSALECVTAADQIAYLPDGTRGSAFSAETSSVSVACYMDEEWGNVVLTHQYDDESVGRIFESSSWSGSDGYTHENEWFPVGDGCAQLTVAKGYDNRAYLYARGTNTCDFSDPERVVERGLSASY